MRPSHRTRRPRLSPDPLEAKDLLSPGPAVPVGISLNSFGTLNIKGDTRDQAARVWIANGQVHARLSHTTYVPIYGGGSTPHTTTDPEKVFALAQVQRISFSGFEGDDSFVNDTGIASTAWGGDGDDSLIGGRGNDTLIGGGGDDTLVGHAGDDSLAGEAGNDTYRFEPSGFRSPTPQSAGADTVTEDANADADTLDFSGLAGGVTVNLASTAAQPVKPGILTLTLSDGLGVENVLGSSGSDRISGNARANVVHAKGGNDTVTGAAGNDILDGEDGNDDLKGNGGNDSVHGGNGNDTIDPGADVNAVTDGAGNDRVDFRFNAVAVTYTTGGGNDTVIGTMFADKLTGSAGNDRLEGRSGDDSLIGGAGNDRLLGDLGENTLHDGSGNDTVDFSLNAIGVQYTTEGGNDVVIGTVESDVITGSAGNDTLYGGPGSDLLYGQAGADTLYGQDGNDELFGQAGWDSLYGQGGDDWLQAGSAGQTAVGGDGTEFNAHKWALNGATYGDVNQTGVGSCVFLSALSGAAWQGADLAGRITYLGGYQYQVKLYNADTEAAWYEPVTFDGTIQMDGDKRLDPDWDEEGEFWTILYQRAYLQMTDAIGASYTDPDYAMYAVTGRSVETHNPGIPFVQPAAVAAALAAGLVVTAGNADQTDVVFDYHSYTVLGVYQESGTWYIKLRNPWGYDGGSVTWGDPNDGILVMTWDDFVGYNDFDRLSVS